MQNAADAPVETRSLVGTWSLRTYQIRGSDGSIRHPLGEQPIGLGIYTSTGFVSAQLMRSGARCDDRRDYIAYAGRWTLDGDQVAHQVDLALHDDWVGTTLVRTVAWLDERLVLAPPPTEHHGITFWSTLTWDRQEQP